MLKEEQENPMLRFHSLKCTASFGFKEMWKHQQDNLHLNILMFINPQIALERNTVALCSIASHTSTSGFQLMWLSQIFSSVKEHRFFITH